MNYLFWLDVEMSGLNQTKDKILEIALVVTDLSYKSIDEYHAVVFQTNEVLNSMDAWCTEHHGKSGLIAKVPMGKKEAEVERDLIEFIQRYSFNEKAIIAGNSIAQDRKFIDYCMPDLAKLLHYRMLDVTSFKIIFENIYQKKFEKKNAHRAIEDIYESIDELKYYLQFVQIT